MITAQPQVHLEHTFNQPVSCSLSDTFYSMDNCLIPLVPVIVIIVNAILAAMVMAEIWLGVLFWLAAGKHNYETICNIKYRNILKQYI